MSPPIPDRALYRAGPATEFAGGGGALAGGEGGARGDLALPGRHVLLREREAGAPRLAGRGGRARRVGGLLPGGARVTVLVDARSSKQAQIVTVGFCVLLCVF